MSATAFEVRGVSRSYRRRTEEISANVDIDLDIPAGDVFGVGRDVHVLIDAGYLPVPHVGEGPTGPFLAGGGRLGPSVVMRQACAGHLGDRNGSRPHLGGN